MTPRDPRNFIRVHNNLPDHPKVEVLSDAAFRLLIETWCWCDRNRTDGYVPAASWARRGAAKARRELVAVGLAHEVEGGVQMHDYTDHQRSRAEMEAVSAKNSANGAKGGRPRKNRTDTEAKPSGLSSGLPTGIADENQEEEEEKEEENTNPQLVVVCRLTNPHGSPDDDEKLIRGWSRKYPAVDLETEADAFIEHNRSKAPDNPSGAWIGWLRRKQSEAVTSLTVVGECPDHPGHIATNCGGCRADRLAGEGREAS